MEDNRQRRWCLDGARRRRLCLDSCCRQHFFLYGCRRWCLYGELASFNLPLMGFVPFHRQLRLNGVRRRSADVFNG